jgi:hypothetical protein
MVRRTKEPGDAVIGQDAIGRKDRHEAAAIRLAQHMADAGLAATLVE